MTLEQDPSRPQAQGPAEADPNADHKLRGNLGVFYLLFTVFSYNAPLAAVITLVPITIAFGNGIGAPMAYVAAAVVAGLFAVGFLKMARHVENPGGFYSFVSVGLGREVGLGASFLAFVCYYLLMLAAISYMGVATDSLVTTMFHGPHIAWWAWTLLILVIVGVFGYLRLDVSARVLTWLLAAESVMVIVHDVMIVAKGGAAGLTANSLLPHNIFSGSIGLGLLFAMLCMSGFEATVIFRDETRDPERTVPRAVYGFIIVAGLLYSFTTWAIIEGLGEQDAVATIATDPPATFMQTTQIYVGSMGLDVIMVLLNTSLIASIMATHNVLSRYAFNLGVDGILPAILGRIHKVQGSPHIASIAVSVVTFFGVLAVIFTKANPELLYAQLAGGFGYALMLLLLLADISIGVYLTRRRPPGTTIWHRLIAPVLTFVMLALTLYLATENFSLLVNGSASVVNTLLVVIYGVLISGIALALVLKRTRPEIYARIGRQ
ncbi:APC family permease [Nocardia tengchongensis]|uniref:APC family permease n=1 Tax=Nocardia tengchongensis TaxID=2055889 RepID=UPI0036BD0763